MNATSSTRSRPVRLGLVVERDHSLAHAGKRGNVAARLHQAILRRDPRFRERQHFGRPLRVGEAFEPALPQGIEDDKVHAALAHRLELMEDARAACAGVLADVKDKVAVLKIVQGARTHGYADAFGQANGRAFVAHVRAVGQVVVAVHPRE